MEKLSKEQELGQRWAEAYDCWVNAPGSSGRRIYVRPQQPPSPGYVEDQGTNAWPQAVRNLPRTMYGMSASDPCGADWSKEQNQAANRRLQADLETLLSDQECWWHSFGFGESWQEKGFVVSCEFSKAMDLRNGTNKVLFTNFALPTQTNNRTW